MIVGEGIEVDVRLFAFKEYSKQMINPLDIELASYASWTALEQINYQGWILRFADGATKRANSVNVIAPNRGGLQEVISYCESWFTARSQPAIFRLLSFVENDNLDSMLADAGYSFIDPSLVLHRDIRSIQGETISLASHDRSVWLEAYCDVSGIDLNSQKTHAEILARIPSSSIFAILEEQDQPVACGLGVIHEGYFGVFDLVSRKQVRNKGYGTNLVRSMIAWAKNCGAQHSYLQVTAQNTLAIRFYEKLGYRYLYHYWYRVQKSR
jgi:GNAT superfamily N-acetyltransferase